MSDVNFLYNQAELALAAYGDLKAGSPNDADNFVSLVDKKFTEKKVNEFAKRYPDIVTQFNDPEADFSATVFNRWVELLPGMMVSAEVKTGLRRLIEFFLAPLLRYKNESVRER